ncbi:MAG: bifunctional DNA-formamidopyrimidine glycosylase/DNA-(apurinic or apyrimidinic site) lyase [Acidobacteriota bacterium]|nr:bifunctional DNA-formamidopyrimidine glycosylase/DNA-(apurinic or apyrimidinic site) lyase [Acidobacteriota bacterium]
MPELPEVEMVARHLRGLIAGRTITKAQLLRPGLAPENPPRQFAQWLRGARVEEVTRRGKHILAHLSNGRTWITHLRMTGRFVYGGPDETPPPHTHAMFWLDDGRKLMFADQRHFGMMMVVRRTELENVTHLSKLAPEPFDAAFTAAYLHEVLKRSKQPIKLFLLDQTRVVGLGNIYAAEALHRAKISPRLVASKLSKPRAEVLYREIVGVLNEAIEAGSTLETDPREVYGRYGDGAYEDSWRVYEREGLPCLTCGVAIRRITQGARSTYFCPRCQNR